MSWQWDSAMGVNAVYDKDGYPAIQVDSYSDKPGESTSPYDMHNPCGLFSLPMDPDTNGAGKPTRGVTVLYALEGGRGVAIPMGDPRVISLLPIIKKGETILYNSFGCFYRLGIDGTQTMFTTDDGTVNGRSVYFQVARDAFRWVAPWGQIVFDASGFHLLHASGARIDLGGIYGVPGAAGLTSYIAMQAGSVDVQASAVSHGAGPVQENLAFAKPVQAVLTELIGLVSDLAGIVASITSGTPGAPAGALVPKLAAITSELTAIQSNAMSS